MLDSGTQTRGVVHIVFVRNKKAQKALFERVPRKKKKENNFHQFTTNCSLLLPL
jgi:hypothetical protein